MQYFPLMATMLDTALEAHQRGRPRDVAVLIDLVKTLAERMGEQDDTNTTVSTDTTDSVESAGSADSTDTTTEYD